METYKNEILSLKSSIKSIQDEIKSLSWVIIEYHFRAKDSSERAQKMLHGDGSKSERMSLQATAANSKKAITDFESILDRLKHELKTKIERLVLCTWYESKKEAMKELKNNDEFYSRYMKENGIDKFDVEWDNVKKIFHDAEVEESLKMPSTNIYTNFNMHLSQLRKKHYESPYGEMMEKELEILNKWKDYFIKNNKWQRLYELMNKKFMLEVNHLIENDEWEKIGL